MARGSITRVVSPITGTVSWRARHSYVDDAGARRHRSKSFPTRKEAEAWNARAQHELRTGAYIEPSTMTLATFAARWLDQAASRLRESTLYRYRQDWRLYIAPALGDVPLAKIRPSQVQALYDALTARDLASNTVTGVHRVLNGMMKTAVADGLIPSNPCTGRTLPKARRDRLRFWTVDQLRTFLTYTADKPTGPLWAFMAYTGVRLGEALALHWDDVDLERRVARIDQTVRRSARGTPVIGRGAKTRASNRTVSLPAMAVMALHRQREEIARLRALRPHLWQDEGLVFPNAYGGLKPPGNVHATFRDYEEAAGVPHISTHGLRHTAATTLVALGVNPKVIQEQLGHESSAITMDLYAHLTESMRRTAADALDALTQPDAGSTTTSGDE